MSGKQVPGQVGGWSDTKPADATVQQIAQQVIGQVAFCGSKAISYRSKVVAGMYYIIKVQVNGNDCIHVRLLEGTDRKITLIYVLYGKTLKDPIETSVQFD